MIAVTIPTHPSRERELEALCAQLRALPWLESITVSYHVDSRQDVANAIAAGTQACPEAEWLLYLEDDMYLGPAFVELPTMLLACPPDAHAAQVFSLHPGPQGWHTFPGRTLVSTGALAFRAPILEGFVPWAPRWYAAHPEHHHASDVLFGSWLRRRHARYAVYWPSLVQHREGYSTFRGRSSKRHSPTYRATWGACPALPC